MFANAFEEFEKDPFFDFGSSPFRDHPFFNIGKGQSLPQLTDGDRRADHKKHHNDSDRALVTKENHHRRQNYSDALALPNFNHAFGGMFENVNKIMQNMSNQMHAMEEASRREDFDGHMYSHSSVYSYNNNGKDEPHVYQAMSETRAGPGGVRETRKAMRDSKSHEERMAVGRHLGDRGHLVERRRNGRTGEQHEDHRYMSLDESEASKFNEEWNAKAKSISSKFDRYSDGRQVKDRNERRAIADHTTRNERRARY